MFKQFLSITLCFVCYSIFGQSAIVINTYEPKNQSVRIAAHTDSSIFLLSIKSYDKGKRDFYISNKPVNKNTRQFDTCLHIAKLFGGKLDTKTFKYSIFQCKDNIIFVFDVYMGTHKKVIAKVVNFNGDVSDAFILDDSDLSNIELMECNYTYELTNKKELLITLRRKYKSGFQRDKCILYNEYMNKLWDYELPKINYHFDVNVIATVYNTNQLIYQVKNGFLDKTGNEWTIKSDYDTIVKKTIDGLTYHLKVPKDSVCLIIANPLQKTTTQVKAYWPFKAVAHIQPISATQVLLYNLVDIDDEKYILPAKKAIYYKRIDTKNKTELFENLTPLDKQSQENLTYECGAGSNGPTSKKIGLISEKIIDGRLYSLFKHNFYEESELVVSCFDIPSNKFEWMYLIPRKLATASTLSDLVFSYFDKKLNVSFYENMENFGKPYNLYIHRKHKMVRNLDDSNFITVSIDENGNLTKSLTDPSSRNFLFPWLTSDSNNIAPHFFESRNFLPLKFLYNTQ